MNVKDLLLALNMMAEKNETQYVLQFEYAYNNESKRLYSRNKLLKFYKNKLINKIKTGNEANTIEIITKEMQLYA